VRPASPPRSGADGPSLGRTKGKIGFHGGTVPIDRPRVRSRAGGEVALPSWEAARAEDWLGKWAMNLMLINVSTRRFGRAVRLPEGDVPTVVADGRSKSAVSRRFVELSAERMAEWMAADLSELDLLAIQIDGLQVVSTGYVWLRAHCVPRLSVRSGLRLIGNRFKSRTRNHLYRTTVLVPFTAIKGVQTRLGRQ